MNLICGINPVLEALSSGSRHFDRLMVVKGLRNPRVSETIAKAGRLGVPLRFEPREALDRLADGVPHQGVIAIVSPKPVMRLDELLAEAHDPALLAVLDRVEDPRNLGAILRSADAAGADGVLVPERHSAGLSETVARTSAGALEHVRVARIGNVTQALGELKESGIWTIGLDAHGGRRWDEIDFKRPLALVLGGERDGLRRLVRETCDELASLPMFGHVDSLNVAVAAGIAFYEVIRQRGSKPSRARPIPPRSHSVELSIVGPDPDDVEQDPGARGVAPTGGLDGEAEEPQNLVRIDADEDVAWAGQREAPKARQVRTGRGGGDGRRRARPAGGGAKRRSPKKKASARPRRSDAPAPAASAAEERPEANPDAPKGRRKRRGRGRRGKRR